MRCLPLPTLALPVLLVAPGAAQHAPLPPAPLDWQTTGPMPGGAPEVVQFTEVAAEPDHVYASTTAGLVRSVDGGASWSLHCTWPEGNAASPRAAVSPVDPLRIVVPRGPFVPSMVSHDGGATWFEPLTGPSGVAVRRAAFDPVDPDVVYLGAGDGVWRSTDGGVSFSQLLASAGLVNALYVDRNNRQRLYAFAVTEGLWTSLDAGSSWSLRTVPSEMTYAWCSAIDPVDGRRLMLGGPGVFLTEDGGVSWSMLRASDQTADVLGFDLLDRDRLFASRRYEGLDESTDRGVSWQPVIDSGLDGLGSHPYTVHASVARPGELLVGGAGGVFRSLDHGMSYQRSNSGLEAHASVTGLALDPLDPQHLVAKTAGSAFVTWDGGASWSESLSGPAFFSYGLVADQGLAGVFYSSSPGGQVWRSDDGGASFQVVLDDPVLYFWHLEPHPCLGGVVFGAGRGVQRSDDGGMTWSNLGLPSSWVWDVAVSPTDSNVLYANTSSSIWWSYDGGATWTAAVTSPPGIVRDLEVDPVDPMRCWAASPTSPGSPGLHRSDDGGVTWVPVAGSDSQCNEADRPASHPGLVLSNSARDAVVLAGSVAGGPLFSMSRGLESVARNFASSPGQLFVATGGQGVLVLR